MILVRAFGAALVALAIAACGPASPKFEGSDVTGVAFGHDFHLTDHTGKARSLADFHGKAVVIFFGYTQCPDYCPTTMSELAAAMTKLDRVNKIAGSMANTLRWIIILVPFSALPQRACGAGLRAQSRKKYITNTADEIVGKPVTMLIPSDRLNEEPQIIARLKKGERVDHFETIRRRKDGSLLDISLTISPIRDANGQITGASKIARDITRQKSIEAEIRRANLDLEQFAFSASHDLQEPLRSVKIYSELLDRRYSDKLDAEAKEFLAFLRTGAVRMEALVTDLLTYSQVSRCDPASEATDANEVLAETLDSLSDTIKENAASVTSDPLPLVQIQRTHLQQVFQNLIGNAIKYRTSDKKPTIHITGERSGHECKFAVSDNGIGIAPEYKETVFGLFKRLHTSAEYSGTGIGLAICQRIVDRYRGRIWVESEPGRGSTFRFTIPDSRDVDG